jgi:hypothetical protein
VLAELVVVVGAVPWPDRPLMLEDEELGDDVVLAELVVVVDAVSWPDHPLMLEDE